MARDDSLSENTTLTGFSVKRSRHKPPFATGSKSTKWNVDITIYCWGFQQAHSSTNEIAATLFNQLNHVFTNICLCNGLDFQIKTIQESKHIKEPRRTTTQRTFYCGFICSLMWGFLFCGFRCVIKPSFFFKAKYILWKKKKQSLRSTRP